MGSGWGGPGPRTSEQKSWQGEIKKGIVLTFLIWFGLCLIWGISFFGVWFLFPDGKLTRWGLDHPRHLVAVIGPLAILCIIGFIVWARQELFDADWTSLQGKHALSGVMPMTPLVRLVFFVRWLREQPKAEKKNKGSVDLSYRAYFGGDDDEDSK